MWKFWIFTQVLITLVPGPRYYLMGVVCLAFSIRGVVVFRCLKEAGK